MTLNLLDHQLMDKILNHFHEQMIEMVHVLLIEHDDHMTEEIDQD
jgi:hypothetical protein